MNEETTNQIHLLFSGFCFIIRIKKLSKSKEELMEHSLTLVKSMQFGQEDCFFAFCGYSKTEAHHSFGPAVRDVYVIHIVLKGRGTYSVGNQRYDLQEGQGFVVPPGQSVFYQADREEPWSYVWMGLGGDLLPRYLKALGLQSSQWSFELTSLQEFKALVFESLAYEGSGITAELALQRQVYRFLELLSQRLKQTSLITESRRVNPYVQQVLELLSSHLPESLSVQELAQKLALHPSYLSRLFKDEVGKGIKEYSNDLRLNMAADLLTSSQLSVEEIASKTGFAGTQSFSKAFKKARGQSPLNFRKASSHLGQEL
ncbi:AraC family transcriptional regulator [Streptococcus sanguinis]|jgi:araC-type DNA-binding domain-containing protein, putative|nr:AraC family transcriptional regulator [Streptococcus sanguinis]